MVEKTNFYRNILSFGGFFLMISRLVLIIEVVVCLSVCIAIDMDVDLNLVECESEFLDRFQICVSRNHLDYFTEQMEELHGLALSD